MDVSAHRCRIVLITPAMDNISVPCKTVQDALRGGDIASVIVPERQLDDKKFQDLLTVLIPVIQKAGIAALVAGDDLDRA